MIGYKVSIHVATLEEAQAVQELALDAFGFPVTICRAERDTQTRPHSEWRSGKCILSLFRANPDKIYAQDDIEIVLQEAGFTPSSASPLLTGLVREGVIKRMGTGVYRLTNNEETVENKLRVWRTS